MDKFILKTKQQLGRAAAEIAKNLILDSFRHKGRANIILATGASQFETLTNLTAAREIDFSKITMFHLDEYIGLEENHPASAAPAPDADVLGDHAEGNPPVGRAVALPTGQRPGRSRVDAR